MSICCVNSVTYREGSHTKTRSLGEGLMARPGRSDDKARSLGEGLMARPGPWERV